MLQRINFILGLLLICLGSFVKSSWIIALLRNEVDDIQAELIIGASLIRIGLVILGILFIVFGRIHIWKSDEVKDKQESKTSFKAIIILTVILAVASVLRLCCLSDGLWFDEILTCVNYARSTIGEIITTYDSQNNHILYSILAHISLKCFGETSWSLRLPAVLFGIASIWALFLLARQFATVLESLLSAALLTVSYHHIWFSQNARGYSGLLFFTIIASWLFVIGINKKRPWLWLFYAVISALGTYTHLTMVFVVISHFIIYLIVFLSRRNESWLKRKWTPLIGFSLAGFFTLLIYSLVLPQMFGSTISHGSIVTVWKNPLWTLIEFFKGVQISFKGIGPGIFAMFIFALGIWRFSRENPMVLGLLFIPSLIAASTTILMGHHLWPRIFFFTIGFGILVIVRGAMHLGWILSKLARPPLRESLYPGVVLVSFIILASSISITAAYGPKQDYLSAIELIDAKKDMDDVVATIGSTTVVYKDFYRMDWTDLKDAQSLKMLLSEGKTIWIVYTFPSYLEVQYPEMMSLIKSDFIEVTKFHGTLNDGEIFVCHSPSSLNKEIDKARESKS